MAAYFPVNNELNIIIVSSKSQINTRSGGLTVSAPVNPESEAVLRVGLGFACRRPRVRPVFVVGVVFADPDDDAAAAAAAAVALLGDIDNGEIGECECCNSGVVAPVAAAAACAAAAAAEIPSVIESAVGLSAKPPLVTWKL